MYLKQVCPTAPVILLRALTFVFIGSNNLLYGSSRLFCSCWSSDDRTYWSHLYSNTFQRVSNNLAEYVPGIIMLAWKFTYPRIHILSGSFFIDLKQVSSMLRNCSANSLLVIDEFGKGTSGNGFYHQSSSTWNPCVILTFGPRRSSFMRGYPVVSFEGNQWNQQHSQNFALFSLYRTV